MADVCTGRVTIIQYYIMDRVVRFFGVTVSYSRGEDSYSGGEEMQYIHIAI